MTAPRTRWDVIKTCLWPDFNMFTIESETVDGADETVMHGLEIEWLGICLQICIGTARPKVTG
jgi:hypothetical protein